MHEIRVSPADGDPAGEEVRAEAERTLGITGLESVHVTRVYRLQGISDEQAATLAEKVLADPVSEECSIDGEPAPESVEIAYKPGVMNPETASLMKAAHDLGIRPEAVDSSHEYTFLGADEEEVDAIVGRLLLNETVEHIVQEPPKALTFEGTVGPAETVPIRDSSSEELAELSKDKLFLNDDEMSIVQDYFRKLNRDPTDAELEVIAGRWSEHCGHKTFNAKLMVDGQEKKPLFRRIKEAAERHFGEKVISAFDDNSGVMRFYDGQAICGKVETHNSPSAIEPYGGAMTGSGGVFRDILGTGQGAKNIISTDMFCFAPPNIDESKLPPGTLHPDYLQRRVIQGVGDYGNRMGIPTANGSIHYHEDFRAKPTVIVGAYGIMPEARAQKGEPQAGDLVVIMGGRTGRDGIHGATFSSGEMTERTANVNSSAVQIGNAIEEKRMSDAILLARDADCIRAITDCGAAGFSSAIGEIGEDVGVTVDISQAPLKYPGLAPWEIWLSESQERMVAAIPPEKIEEFQKICQEYNVEATVLGEFDGSNTLTVNYGEQNVVELDYDFLKNGLPQRVMEARWEWTRIEEIRPESPESQQEWIDRFKAVLSHGNVCSKEPVVRQYDHGVQGGNVVAPFGGVSQEGPNDALVIRPMLGKPYGIVQSHGMNPILNRLDPYLGSIWATTEAMANYVAVGGDPDEVSLVGNYIAPYPDEETMGALDQIVEGATDMMDVLGAPVISGKDSLSSTYRGKDGEVIKIPPVYAVSAFGRIPDVEKTVTSAIKRPGKSVLYLVGKPDNAMGGSAYYDVVGGSSKYTPFVHTPSLRSVFRGMHQAIKSGEVLACHDISEGGLATAVAEMCFGSRSGAHLFVPRHKDPESFLFSETAGCFVVELDKGTAPENVFGDVPTLAIGTSLQEPRLSAIEVKELNKANWNGDNLFEIDVEALKQAWQAPMKGIFHS
ncbi:MAG TPA: phosphoribosylformylglycinamidine synthase subunit PurL [Candidatus Saccharimonadales bacterium]|nr:phosphoribosylformylglycinamidine synthase subunit PurL [Candidatus Saccharimonadales bacterium]